MSKLIHLPTASLASLFSHVADRREVTVYRDFGGDIVEPTRARVAGFTDSEGSPRHPLAKGLPVFVALDTFDGREYLNTYAITVVTSKSIYWKV